MHEVAKSQIEAAQAPSEEEEEHGFIGKYVGKMTQEETESEKAKKKALNELHQVELTNKIENEFAPKLAV